MGTPQEETDCPPTPWPQMLSRFRDPTPGPVGGKHLGGARMTEGHPPL